METPAPVLELKATSIYPCLLIFRLNHRLFLNSLEGVTDEQAKERISGHSNPLIWIATHTVWARYNALNMLGGNVENPYKGQFEGFRPIEDTDTYPTLEELRQDWKKVSALMKEALHNVTEEHLALEAPFKAPTGDATIGGAIIFMAQHESYDIGQMAYLKKYLTKEAMKY